MSSGNQTRSFPIVRTFKGGALRATKAKREVEGFEVILNERNVRTFICDEVSPCVL